MRFVIADTHFGHKNILKYEGQSRPFKNIEEHDRELVERWNSVVKDEDKVYHLGDVFFGKKNFELVKALKGKKRLIMGNHDIYGVDYKEAFEKVYGAYIYRDCILTHVPVHPNQFKRFKLNIHGHMHSEKMDDRRYVCVSVEQLPGLKPALLDIMIYGGP
jgi:calcineurin-like phosphoesterase family protein